MFRFLQTFFYKLNIFLEMVQVEHTLFALPFAWIGYFMGARGTGRAWDLFWVTLALIGARTAGMCLNRLMDRKLDRQNPRTAHRALVRGTLSLTTARVAAVLGLGTLVGSSLMLNALCFFLSPLAVFLVVFYHGMKRYTTLCHFGIGCVLACAPIGGWIAATGRFEMGTWVLGAAVLTWVAGFDILYSIQDEPFDRSLRLYSIPARYGTPVALGFARISHVLALGFLAILGIILDPRWLYWMGWSVVALLLTAEHVWIGSGRRDRIGPAFFNLNGALSAFFFVFVTLDLLML